MKKSFLLPAFAMLAIAATRSASDGVFTKSQASRGQAAYAEDCARCHAENLSGGEGAPALVGADFIGRWQGKTAGELFESIRATMPLDEPGSLSRRKCADITAYLLSANEFPAGDKELENSAASLHEILIKTKQ